MIVSVFLGNIYSLNDLTASIIWPAIGVSFALFISYQKNVYLPLAIGSFLGYFLSHFIFSEALSIKIIGLDLLLSQSGVLLSYYFAKWTSFWIHSVKLTFINILKYGLIITTLALSTSLVAHSFLLIFGQLSFDGLLKSAFIWFSGDFYGLLIFGTALIFSLFYDDNPIFITFSVNEALLYGLFILFSFLFFSDLIPYVSYLTHRYLFIPFAVIIAFKFPFRTYYTFSIIFLVFMIYLPPYQEASYFNYMFDINLFLLTLLAIFLSLKLSFTQVKSNNLALEIKQERLKRLIDSVEKMMSISPRLDKTDQAVFMKEAKRMFRTIFNLFEKADYASCMVVGDKVTYVDAIGYNLDFLNSLKFDVSSWMEKVTKPVHIKNAESRIKQQLKENYEDFTNSNPAVKESVFLSVQLAKDFHIEMSFDIMINSDDTFTQSDLTYFESMQIFMNSFYETYVMSQGYGDKKNQILNSLIKTIALYDPLIYHHSKDVAYIAEHIAIFMGLNDEQITNLYWAGIVHDIGKINIDKAILNKPTMLTHLEFKAVKNHPITGFKTLNESSALSSIALLVRHHHERYDGFGYPDGLKASQMSIDSYILAMSEAIASMMRMQEYSHAFTDQAIIDELTKENGKQFHPNVVKSSITLIHNGLLTPLKKK